MSTHSRKCPTCNRTTEAPFCPDDGSATAPIEPSPLAQAGDLIGERYRIIALVGEGGFGQVFEARHQSTQQRMAIKILRTEAQANAVAVARFSSEARICGRLSSPHTVRIVDHGATTDGKLYIAMEFLDGDSLAQRLAKVGRLATISTALIAVQVLKSLQEAHAHGLIHRDLKPDNIVLCDIVGAPDFAKVIDFGVAKLTRVEDGQPLTRSGVVVGTPQYMSPEQVQALPVDGRADLYALGVVLFQCLSGRLPFERDSGLAVCIAHVNEPPPPLSPLAPDVDVILEGIVLRALAKRPADRFATATAMLDAVQAWLASSPPSWLIDAAVTSTAARIGATPSAAANVVLATTDEAPLAGRSPPAAAPAAAAGALPNAATESPTGMRPWRVLAALAVVGAVTGLAWAAALPPVAVAPGRGALTSEVMAVQSAAGPVSADDSVARPGFGRTAVQELNKVAPSSELVADVGPSAQATATGVARQPEQAAQPTIAPSGAQAGPPKSTTAGVTRAKPTTAAADPCKTPRPSLAWCTRCPEGQGSVVGSADDCACRRLLDKSVGDAAWCGCFPDHLDCPAPCKDVPGSLTWCQGCAAAKALSPTSKLGCACRKALGTLQQSDGEWCTCFANDVACGTPTGCAAVRLSPQWCRNCDKVKRFKEFSPDWCQCRKALGEDVRGSETWCACFAQDTHCPQPEP